MTYRFTGDAVEHFPSLGVDLSPGDTITTALPCTHPRLVPVEAD